LAQDRHFGRDDLSYGQFGENLTVDSLPDDETCIGDRCRGTLMRARWATRGVRGYAMDSSAGSVR
jgi:hypothetical protein